MKAFGKILIGIPVIALGTYAVVGFLGVPYLAQSALESAVKKTNPKATVSVRSFSFNPFTLAADIKGIKIRDYVAEGAQIDFDVERLTAGVTSLNLLKRNATVSQIIIDTPALSFRKNLKRSGSGAGKIRKEATSRPVAESTQTWTWTVAGLRIQDGSLQLTDQGLKKPASVRVDSVQVNVGAITSALGKTSFTFNARPLGGDLKASGSFSISEKKANLSLNTADMNLAMLSPWTEDATKTRLKKGLFTLSGKAQADQGHVSAQADASVASLSAEKNGVPVFSAGSIRAQTIKLVTLDPLTLSIRSIKADLGLQKAVGIDENVTNLLGDIVEAFGHAKTAKRIKSVQKLDKISVSNITYKNGKLHSTSSGFRFLENLNAIWTTR
mgnify:FL=1